jgi:hypothetical protein
VKTLGVEKAAVVGHDIGLMVAYAYAAQFPAETDKLVLMDAFLPGVEGWEAVYNNPGLWHFRFHGSTPEALVAGRERTYPDSARQMLFEYGRVDSTTRVLVHGGAGNVGAYAVQFAKRVAREVIALPDQHEAARRQVRGVFFLVKVSSEGLKSLSDLIDTRELAVQVRDVLPLRDA